MEVILKRADVVIAGLVIMGVIGLVSTGQIASQVKLSSQSGEAVAVGQSGCGSQILSKDDNCKNSYEIPCPTLVRTTPPGPSDDCSIHEYVPPYIGTHGFLAAGQESGGENYYNVQKTCPSAADRQKCRYAKVGVVYSCKQSADPLDNKPQKYWAVGGSC
jgi:hypothetical protein